MSTIFEDSFGGSGELHGRSPAVGFDSLTWINDSNILEMTSGFVTSQNVTNTNSFGNADYGNGGINNTHAEDFECSFVFRTGPSVTPNDDGHRGLRITLIVGGKTFFVQIKTYFSGDWVLEFDGGSSTSASPTLAADTEYEGTIGMSDGVQVLDFLGESLQLFESYDNDDGLSQISIMVGATIGLKDLLIEGAIEAVEGDYEDATGSLSSSIGPATIAASVADTTGSASSSTTSGVGANATDIGGVLSSQTSGQVTTNQNVTDQGTLSSEVYFDVSLNVNDETGDLSSEVNSTVVANSLDSGMLSSESGGTVARSFNVTDETGVFSSQVTYRTAADDVTDDSGVLTSSVTTQRITHLDVTDAGTLSSSTTESAGRSFNVTDKGVLSSEVTTQVIASLNVVDDTGVLTSQATYDALFQAWVMNAQFAMARYSGLQFQSACVLDGRVIALGTSGFFELDGETDDGAEVEATMRTGFTDMGSKMLKALGDIHFGYASTGSVEVTITQYGAKKGSFTYTMPPADADAPRAGRVKPGKGLKSQYYRFEIKNTDGAPLALDYAHTIPLPSQQRSF